MPDTMSLSVSLSLSLPLSLLHPSVYAVIVSLSAFGEEPGRCDGTALWDRLFAELRLEGVGTRVYRRPDGPKMSKPYSFSLTHSSR